MSQAQPQIVIDLLVVSRYDDPPAPDMVSKAIANAKLGAAEWRYPQINEISTPGRQKIGYYDLAIADTAASAKVTVYHYEKPITAPMNDSAFALLTRGLSANDTRTLREGRLSYNLSLTTPQQQVLPTLNWGMRLAGVLIELTEGAVVDPAAERCCSREQIASYIGADPLAHVAFQSQQWTAESTWLHTHGLQKFGQPELGMVAVPLSLEPEARAFLSDVAVNLINGGHLAAGGEIDLGELGRVLAVHAPVDAEHQAPYNRFRLTDMPQPGEREGVSANRLLKTIALADAEQRAAAGDTAGALDTIERILAADLDDCAALALKARLSLAAGEVNEAIDLGELMELRVPDDYRGPFTIGIALTTLGRYREALNALNRAIECEPEAADVFAARATVYERLGNRQMAVEDRTHANYLKS